MLRNHKWLELAENLENVLKNTDGVVVENCEDYSLDNLPYTVYNVETNFGENRNSNNAYISLRVYNSENDFKRYRLILYRNFELNLYSEYYSGGLTVCYDKENEKITFGRDSNFKKSDETDKPLTSEQVEQEFNKSLELIQKLNYVKTLCDNNSFNEQLVTVYLKAKDLNITELDNSQLKDHVEYALNYYELDTDKLFYDILSEYFDCDTQEKRNVLSSAVSWSERPYFIYKCIAEGVVKDVVGYNNKFYSL